MSFNQNQILAPITTQNPDLFGRPGKCAFCGYEFNTVQVRSKAYTVIRMDPDLYTAYSGTNPTWYQVIVCPRCRFSADWESFEKAAIKDKDALAEAINQVMDPTEIWTGERDIKQGIRSLELAILCTNYYRCRLYDIAVLALRLNWLYRELMEVTGDDYTEKRSELIDLSIRNFESAFSKENIENTKFGLGGVSFILGELYRQRGNYELSLKWFSQCIHKKLAKGRILDIARDQMELGKNQWEEAKASGEYEQSMKLERQSERCIIRLFADQLRWLEKIANESGQSYEIIIKTWLDLLKERKPEFHKFSSDAELKEFLSGYIK